MEFGAQQVKELREKTGAGMMDCKKALTEANGEMEQAVVVLRKKGLASAQKKSARTASEGMIGHYIHAGGKIGVLVEVNCETDFAARNADFQSLVKDVAMHICAQSPRWVRREEIPAEEIQKERDIYTAQVKGKPANIVEKILSGKLESFYQMTCLYDQPFVKEPGQTVQQLIEGLVGRIGENIRVRRFARFQTGEGLEKRSTDLAADVQAALGGQ